MERSDREIDWIVDKERKPLEARVAGLEALLRRMLCSNEMSNGWKDEIQAALRQK